MSSVWVPFTLPWNDAPIDLSFVYEDERPAGRHGFVRADGGRFVFEDGTNARFWGCLFNAGANFPTHEAAQMVARRLAKFGVNLVRTHMLDAEWGTPNIFFFNRAKSKPDTRSFDSESLERLDYLIASLKEQGIYIYLDMLCFRKFLPGDGVEAVSELPQWANPYAYFDSRLIELQKEFNEHLWNHVNSHTGLAYKDDPAIALAELMNENDFFNMGYRLQTPVLDSLEPARRDRMGLEPYRSRFEASYRTWAEDHDVELSPEPVDFTHIDRSMARFFVEVQQGYYREMIAHLRDIGVRVPIAGTNWGCNLGLTESLIEGDFTDNHVYWGWPSWRTSEGAVNQPMVKQVTNVFPEALLNRTLAKPFFLSEWDHAWPHEWRAESPLFYAAIAAFQGWSGASIHAYRYDTQDGPVDRIGGGAGRTDARTVLDHNYWDTFNDPAKFGLFYHAALIMRRGDVRQGSTRAAVAIEDDPSGEWRLKRCEDIPALQLAAERHLVGLSLPNHREQSDIDLDPNQPAADLNAGEVRSDSGELYRNWQIGYGLIDTPRTKAAYGFIGKAGRIEFEDLMLEIDTDFATVAVSSLTDDPIGQSLSLLLTAVGRCDNTDARYDVTHRWLADAGRAPILIEAIEGQVRLRTARSDLRVWMIGQRGDALSRVPTTTDDGWLSFRIGLLPPWNYWETTSLEWRGESTIYYLIRS